MAGTRVSAMSKDISGLFGSTGERCARPKPQDAMAPLVMIVWDSPGTRRRSACRTLDALCVTALHSCDVALKLCTQLAAPSNGLLVVTRTAHRTHANDGRQDRHEQRPAANSHRIGQHRTLQSE
jgi:hypothetical protein